MSVSQRSPQSSWRARSIRALVLVSLAAGTLTGVASTAPARAAGPVMGPPTVLSVFGANATGRMKPPAELTSAGAVTADVSAGYDHALAVTSDGALFAWGDESNDEGRVPFEIAQAGPFRAVAAGRDNSFAVTRSGAVKAWGLGTGAGGRFELPWYLPTTGIVDVSVGGTHALALDSNGKVYAWGDDFWGQSTVPDVVKSKRVVKIATGGTFSLAVTQDNHVYAWGISLAGKIDVPAALQGLPIDEIDAGLNHAVALTKDGRLFTWGDNSAGQLNVTAGYDRWAHVSAADNYTVAYPLSGSAELGAPQVWGEGAGPLFSQRPHIDQEIPVLEAGGGYVIYGQSVLLPTTPGQITGSARVGEQLSGTFATFKPLTPELLVGGWYVGESSYTKVGDGTDFTPGPGLLGKKLHFHTAGFLAGYVTGVSSSASITILPGRLSATIPTISGRARVGQVLTASTIAQPTADRFVYSWFADGSPRQAAANGTYTVSAGDVGKRITVQIAVHKDGYDSINTELSAQTAPVQDAQTMTVTRQVDFTGAGKVGQPLIVVPPLAQPAPDAVSYQWYRGAAKIDGATGSTYTPVAADRGALVGVRATLTKSDYDDASSDSNAVRVADGEFTTVGRPTISGRALVGERLTANVGASPAPDSVTFDWYVGDTLRVAGGAATYVPVAGDAGKAITVQATVRRDGFGNGVSARSAPTAAVAPPEVKVLAPAQVSGRAVAGGLLTAIPPRTAVGATYRYQWLRAGVPIPGAQASTVRLGAADVGKQLAVRVAVSSAGWSSVLSTSPTTARTVKATPALRATVRGAGKRTKLVVKASATGLPALTGRLVVRSGKVVRKVALSRGRAVTAVPRTKKRITIVLASTSVTGVRTLRVKGK